MLNIEVGGNLVNIAEVVLKIIDAYVDTKQQAFQNFIENMQSIQNIQNEQSEQAFALIASLLNPQVDARIFEIISFALLKVYYSDQAIYWGWTPDTLIEDSLTLFKTGRTNANDGGIDFVMKPLGRFFQVTETVDVNKYFLDIDKIQRYPLTFVIKSEASADSILKAIRYQAQQTYQVRAIVEKYMAAIEEIINIPILLERFEEIQNKNKLNRVIDEIILHSKVEFNLDNFASKDDQNE
ncbi:MAG: hypothetical protein D6737_15065 [Chloroflexi bacterium]|nr:MAG: hypothetical protein D6737_15065 [Chloroflexota bacterium]